MGHLLLLLLCCWQPPMQRPQLRKCCCSALQEDVEQGKHAKIKKQKQKSCIFSVFDRDVNPLWGLFFFKKKGPPFASGTLSEIKKCPPRGLIVSQPACSRSAAARAHQGSATLNKLIFYFFFLDFILFFKPLPANSWLYSAFLALLVRRCTSFYPVDAVKPDQGAQPACCLCPCQYAIKTP